MTKESLLTFPCQFPIKVIGKREHDISSIVSALVIEHFQERASDHSLQIRQSSNAAYHAVTVTVAVNSQEELDAFYQVLSARTEFIMVL